MKTELAIVRRGRQPAVLTIDPKKLPTTPSRKRIRESTDAVIHEALKRDDMPALIRTMCTVMLEVAQTLDIHDEEPDVADLVEAAQALIEAGRAVMDRGLQLQSWETTKCGAVMLELTVRGMFAACSIPYDEALLAVYEGRQPPGPIKGESAHERHDDEAIHHPV
jgi:hypothetical protein